MSDPKIVLLAGKGISTNILFHALNKEFPIHSIILEEPVSRRQLLVRRIKKLGLWKVASQVLFQLIIVKVLNFLSAKRKAAILQANGLQHLPLPSSLVKSVQSVNDDQCLQLLKEIAPSLVIVNGTRIISRTILNAIPARFINIHAGITPRYRGVHGAYWALVNNDAAHCGVTVHQVDAGIDTGSIIGQSIITITPRDNFVTYPLLQLAAGIPLMKKAIADSIQNCISLTPATGESRLWSHPGFFQFLYYRIGKGKK